MEETIYHLAGEPSPRRVGRVLIADDRPELRALLRIRINLDEGLDVVGEAGNGLEAVRLARALAPAVVVLDLDMPVMTGAEAIPRLRQVAPGMAILLFTAAHSLKLPPSATPDAWVRKGVALNELVRQLHLLVGRRPSDVLRLELGRLPLRQAITAFDTWAGLILHVQEALDRGDELTRAQLSGSSAEEIEALMGVYTHIAHELQAAARAGHDHVSPVIHVPRALGALARHALASFNEGQLAEFWKAWGYVVPDEAVAALSLMRARLLDVLPASASEAAAPAPAGSVG